MDVNLGPWTAQHPANSDLADAMGEQAKKTVNSTTGFTAIVLKKGSTATKGYGISGVLMSVVTKDGSTKVFITFSVTVDGFLANVPPIKSTASASGTNTAAKDAVEGATEDTVGKILQKFTTGSIVRQG